MRLDINLKISGDPAIEHRLDKILSVLIQQGETIMSTFTDFAAKQAAYNTAVSSDLDAIQAQITTLNTLITTLQDSAGTVTAADQVTIDSLQAAGAALQVKADALANKTPPVPVDQPLGRVDAQSLNPPNFIPQPGVTSPTAEQVRAGAVNPYNPGQTPPEADAKARADAANRSNPNYNQTNPSGPNYNPNNQTNPANPNYNPNNQTNPNYPNPR